MLIAMTMLFTGCVFDENKTLDVEKTTTISTVIGKTAGYACELSKTKTAVREEISKILDITAKIVPAKDQTFVVAWSPVIDVEVTKLSLGESETALVKTALKIACEGLDYVFVKYPTIKDKQELVNAAVNGFISGYKSVCSDAMKASVLGADGLPSDIDHDAYVYFRTKIR